MSADCVYEGIMDISKLKVPDLKKELKTRGLSSTGNKNELVERLQAALQSNQRISNDSVVDDLDEDLLNEDDDDVHLETTESVISDILSDTALNDSLVAQKRKSGDLEGKPAAKKVVLNRNTPVISDSTVTNSKHDNNGTEDDNVDADGKKVIKLSEISAKERLEMRARKFNVSLGTEARKVARAERFGTESTSNKNSKIDTNVTTSIDVLKKRAERFGGSVSSTVSSVEAQEKLEKRKERFGIVTPEDKAKQRLERFKQPVL